MNLIETLNDLGTTSLITLELRASGASRSLQLEEYLAQGVIILQTSKVGSSLTKTIQIEKMRGVNHDDQPRPYKITSKGIVIIIKSIKRGWELLSGHGKKKIT